MFAGPVIGGVLRALRQEAGLSQRQLAERSGIQRPIVSRIERGDHRPNMETIGVFARACGASPLRVYRVFDAWLEG